ncbi:Transcriptional regulator [Ascosphaera aggregata]|nr:Transcriptional regulator [Ascosphaera aggregata]
MVPPLPGSKVKGKTSRASAFSSSHDVHSSTRISPLPTTHSSTSVPALHTATSLFLDHDVPRLLSSASVQYATLIDKVNSVGTIPDPRTLELLISGLKNLSTLADERGEVCNAAMRELSNKRKDVAYEEQREFELNSREKERERERGIKKEPIDDEEDTIRSASGTSKGQGFRKRKQKDDRPLPHGAHHMARQDGSSKRHGKAAPAFLGAGTSTTPTKRRRSKSVSPVSSTPSQSPRTTGATAGGSAVGGGAAGAGESTIDAPSLKDEEEDDDDESSQYSHQPEPQSAIPHYQVFGPNPLTFDDPTVYHIREVTPGMTDEEKKEIFSVARFPRSDLSEKLVGVPPDKDFSNTKPTNQVNATTFANYVEAFARPLGDQDLAFLKERGDRVTPFIFPRRGKQHYKEKWAAEDGMIELDSNAGLPPNQGRGSIDQITDETAETDQVSAPPLISRLFSLLRFENHETPELAGSVKSEIDNSSAGVSKGGDSMDLDHAPSTSTEDEAKQRVDSATAFPDVSLASFKAPTLKLEHGQLDERLKAELRYTGIMGPEDQPDYDAHYDDAVADRLRLLQAELRRVIITNNARKARLHDLVKDRLAYQEYKTIHDDLDNQVQQAYLKRTRTLGKAKKGAHYKGRAGGHVGSAMGHAAGVGRPGIGDAARTLMDRRRRWEECIGPVIKDCNTMVPGKDESCFDPKVMVDYEKVEMERWDEEED